MKSRLEALLREAFELGASDIHMTVGVPPIFRLNGELQEMRETALSPTDTEGMAKAMLTDPQWTTFKDRGELDFSYGIAGVSRFRVNVYMQRNCVSLAIRVIPTKIPSLAELNMPDILKQLMMTTTQGLILVTGPTGSGKSTTLAAMIDHMNQLMRKHIITLEDPIEYMHKHRASIIDQREVGFDTGHFSSGLRACLRQDPDVILVGEMRDLETMATAITAAETGHLVLATLHTTSASSTIDRLIDVFPADQQGQIRIQLASVLAAIISQRLIPTNDKQGRAPATEILINNPAIQNLIRNGKNHQIESVLQMSRAEGMQTMQMAVTQLYETGKISREQATPYLQKGMF